MILASREKIIPKAPRLNKKYGLTGQAGQAKSQKKGNKRFRVFYFSCFRDK